MNPAHRWHADQGTEARPVYLAPVLSPQTKEMTQRPREVAGATRLPSGALGLQLVSAIIDQWAGRRLAAWIERNYGPGSYLMVKGELVPLTDEMAVRLRALAHKAY